MAADGLTLGHLQLSWWCIPTLIARLMEPTWGPQDPGGPHVGPMDFAIWEAVLIIDITMWYHAQTVYCSLSDSFIKMKNFT